MNFKYDCEVITDMLVLYKDDALSPKSRSIVEEHISHCENCKKNLDILLAEPEISEHNEKDADVQNEINIFSAFLGRVRKGRLAVFGVFAVLMLSMLSTWFGYDGVTEISGINSLDSPFFVLGIILCVFGIWFDFKLPKTRLITGCLGGILLLFSEIYSLALYACGSTWGISIFIFNFSFVSFSFKNFVSALSSVHAGFYISLILTVVFIEAFIIFSRRINVFKSK